MLSTCLWNPATLRDPPNCPLPTPSNVQDIPVLQAKNLDSFFLAFRYVRKLHSFQRLLNYSHLLHTIQRFQIVAHRVVGIVEALKLALDDGQLLLITHLIGDGLEVA